MLGTLAPLCLLFAFEVTLKDSLARGPAAAVKLMAGVIEGTVCAGVRVPGHSSRRRDCPSRARTSTCGGPTGHSSAYSRAPSHRAQRSVIHCPCTANVRVTWRCLLRVPFLAPRTAADSLHNTHGGVGPAASLAGGRRHGGSVIRLITQRGQVGRRGPGIAGRGAAGAGDGLHRPGGLCGACVGIPPSGDPPRDFKPPPSVGLPRCTQRSIPSAVVGARHDTAVGAASALHVGRALERAPAEAIQVALRCRPVLKLIRPPETFVLRCRRARMHARSPAAYQLERQCRSV